MDYSKLEFNPIVLEKGELIYERYDDLALNPTYCELSEEDFALGYTHELLSQLVSFVILYIDDQSPYYRELDIDKRINYCMKDLGIKKGSLVYEQVESHSPRFSDVLYEYFVWINNIPFESWLSLKTQIHHQYKYLRAPYSAGEDIDLEADRKSKVQERLVRLETTLMEKQAKLFPNERIQRQISRENTKKSLTGYAERYAQHHPVLNPEGT